MNEASKKFMTMSIWVSILLFVLRCFLGWGDLGTVVNEKKIFECGYLVFSYTGEAISLTAIFMACFNKWWWKWKPLNILSGGMPILAKRYKGKIHINRGGVDQDRDSEMGIEQTFLNITVKLGTVESSSNSITATIETVNNEKQLIYTYLNTPRAEIQDRSPIHYGTAMLKINDPKHLMGNYYTIRLSRGSMDFEAVKEKS